MNSYSFPERALISEPAKDLIKAGLLTIEALQTSGLYTSEEIAAIKA